MQPGPAPITAALCVCHTEDQKFTFPLSTLSMWALPPHQHPERLGTVRCCLPVQPRQCAARGGCACHPQGRLQDWLLADRTEPQAPILVRQSQEEVLTRRRYLVQNREDSVRRSRWQRTPSKHGLFEAWFSDPGLKPRTSPKAAFF